MKTLPPAERTLLFEGHTDRIGVSKRKVLRVGPERPKGCNAMGIRIILRSRRSAMTVSQVVVVGFVFTSFLISVVVSRH